MTLFSVPAIPSLPCCFFTKPPFCVSDLLSSPFYRDTQHPHPNSLNDICKTLFFFFNKVVFGLGSKVWYFGGMPFFVGLCVSVSRICCNRNILLFPLSPLEECMFIHGEARCSAFCTEKLASEVRWQSQGQIKSLADTLLEPESAGMNSVHTSAHGLSAL